MIMKKPPVEGGFFIAAILMVSKPRMDLGVLSFRQVFYYRRTGVYYFSYPHYRCPMMDDFV